MTQPLFDPEKCDVEDVPSLDFNFVEDCSIAGPPPPIYDCQLPIVPREPPPPLCPEFTGAITVTAAFEGCLNASNSTIVFTKLDDEPCRVALDLDLAIPIPPTPCPTLTSGDVNVAVGYEGCVSGPTAALTITKTVTPATCETPQNCEYVFDLDLAIPIPQPPCPEINVAGALNYGGNVSAPLLLLSVTPTTITGADCNTPDTCQFDIDLQLDLPSPCPEITASGSVIVTPGREEPALTFTATKDGENCAFALDVNLELPPPPPCPEITGTISVTPADTPTGALLITATPPTVTGDPCQFNVDIEIGVPVPCPPEITISGSILQTPGRDTPTMSVGVSGPGPSDCNYDLNIDIELPTPRPCPDITGVINVYEASALTGSVTITSLPTESATDACQLAIDIDIGVPVPCIPEITATGSILQTPGRDTPTLAVSVADVGVSGCDKKLTIDVELPTPRPCPTFTGAVEVQYGEPGGTLVITHSPPDSATTSCDYALDLSLYIPEPCTPDVTTTGSILETPGRDAPWLQFTSTPGATGCDYSLNVEIELPTPRPCPTFTGAVNVYESETATGAITITSSPPASRTEACAYAIDVAVGYQRTRLEKGAVTIDWTVCDGSPSCDVTIHPPDTAGVQRFDLDIRLPRPPTYTGGEFTLKGADGATYGTGQINIPATGCTRGVSGAVTLNVTACGPAGGI